MKPAVEYIGPSSSYASALLEVLASAPTRVVVVKRGVSITAGELLEKIGNAADIIEPHLLNKPGLPPRIGLMFYDNLQSIIHGIGCWLLGAEPHFLDHRLAHTDLPKMMVRDKIDLILTGRAHISPPIPGVIAVVDQVLSPEGAEGAKLRIRRARQAGLDPETPSQVTSSSGVSGPPKLKSQTQKQLFLAILTMVQFGRRGPWGTMLSATSVAFSAPRLLWWRNLLYGRLIISHDLLTSTAELDSALLDPLVEECSLAPVVIRQLLQHHNTVADRTAPRYPHLLKLLSVGGPASASEKLAAYHQLTPCYLMSYSSAETGIITLQGGSDLLSAPGSCGRAIPRKEISIVDKDGMPLPCGQIGRVKVTHLLWQDVAAVNWPGDLGWLDAEGFLYLTSRGEGIICRNGESFWAGTLEAHLLQDPNLLDAAVLVLHGGDADDRLVFGLRIRPEADEQRVASQLIARLPNHQRPETVVFATAEDISTGGKLLRARLLEKAKDSL